jgi:gliding motility-associated-like protein
MIAEDELGCQSVDSFTISANSPVVFEATSIAPTCQGDSDGELLLHPATAINTASINGLLMDSSSLSGLSAGTYELIIEDSAGCQDTLNINIGEGTNPPVVFHDSPIIVQLGDSVLLTPLYDNTNSLRWIDSSDIVHCDTCARGYAQPVVDTELKVEVVDSLGCKSTAVVELRIIEGPRIGVPTAFSPNGDGVNDFWSPIAPANVASIDEVMIFDRWGELVYNAVDLPLHANDRGWDGTFLGEPMNPAVFVFLVKYSLLNGKQHVVTGDLHLIR